MDRLQSEAVKQAMNAIGYARPAAAIAPVRPKRRLVNQALAAKINSRA